MSKKRNTFIVILNWNSPQDTVRCVQSFLATGFRSEQLVVVDNASTDDSVDIFRKELSLVKLLKSPVNGGYAAGNNIGIRYALDRNAEYILLLNNDTEVINGQFIFYLMKLMEGDRSLGVVGPRVLFPDGKTQPTILHFPTLWNIIISRILRVGRLKSHNYRAGQYVEVVSGVCFFVRASVFRSVGLISESFFMYGEEGEFCRRLKKNGWGVRYEPVDSVVHYHMKGDPTIERRGRKYYYSRRNTVLSCWGNGQKVQAVVLTMLFSLSLVLKTVVCLPFQEKKSYCFLVWKYVAGRCR